MNWNFGAGFFSPHNLSRAGLVAGAGLGASALAPQDAEGAVRSDILGVIPMLSKAQITKGR